MFLLIVLVLAGRVGKFTLKAQCLFLSSNCVQNQPQISVLQNSLVEFHFTEDNISSVDLRTGKNEGHFHGHLGGLGVEVRGLGLLWEVGCGEGILTQIKP